MKNHYSFDLKKALQHTWCTEFWQ